MDASRTQEATHGWSIWSWVVIGAIGLALAATIAVWNGIETDNVVVRAPAEAEAQVGPPTKDFALRGRGTPDSPVSVAVNPGCAGPATAIREGGAYVGAIPIGTPDSFTDVRESGAYYGTDDVTATPRGGRCPVKQGC